MQSNSVLNLEKNATEASCMNRGSAFEWHQRFKEGRKSLRDDERCGRSKEVRTPVLIGQRVRVTMFQSGQWHFYQDNAPVPNSILVTDYLTKMGIKTVRHPPYGPELAPRDFCLFPKLTGCHMLSL